MITSDPKIVGIMLSDSVIVEQGTGKLSLLNCFSGFNAERFPFVTPHFFISVFVTNLEGKPDEINMTVRIESPRNGHVYASASITMRPTSPDSEPLVRTDVLSLPFRIQASLPNAGIYNACVLLNNQPVDQRSFRVNARTETRGVIEGEQKT